MYDYLFESKAYRNAEVLKKTLTMFSLPFKKDTLSAVEDLKNKIKEDSYLDALMIFEQALKESDAYSLRAAAIFFSDDNLPGVLNKGGVDFGSKFKINIKSSNLATDKAANYFRMPLAEESFDFYYLLTSIER